MIKINSVVTLDARVLVSDGEAHIYLFQNGQVFLDVTDCNRMDRGDMTAIIDIMTNFTKCSEYIVK